jgi:hypothetical protein
MNNIPVIFATALNLPWSLLGIMLALLSVPRSVGSVGNGLVFRVKSWWWARPLWWLKGIRGFASGNVVVLGPNEEPRDLEHELVHVEQFTRYPLIFPVLHAIETVRFGYQNNRFEREAYGRAGNIYKHPGYAKNPEVSKEELARRLVS